MATNKPSKTATKATKTTTTKAAPKPAAKAAPKVGQNAATEAINQAALEGATGAAAKADAVKNAAALRQQAEAGELQERRFAVAPGRAIRKGGVTYRGDQGDHIDLSAIDSDRFLADGTILELGDVEEDDDAGTSTAAEGSTLTGDGGVTVPHPDTPEGKALQQQQEAEAAAKDAEQTGKGLPSGAENF